jgi:hypothetical protein
MSCFLSILHMFRIRIENMMTGLIYNDSAQVGPHANFKLSSQEEEVLHRAHKNKQNEIAEVDFLRDICHMTIFFETSDGVVRNSNQLGHKLDNDED